MLVSLKTQLDTVQGLIDIHSGQPTDLFLKGCYHRHPDGYPKLLNDKLDVAKDGCGLIWLSPTTPANKDSVETLLSLLKEIFEQHGFHLYATLSFINERSLAVICNPVFDATDKEQISRAKECTTIALKKCIAHGFPPYRLANVHWQEFYQQLDPQHQGLLAAIKQKLDPNNIISPGRYGIGSDNET
jgi:4-cresol dehydrogenase (hydroxylating)